MGDVQCGEVGEIELRIDIEEGANPFFVDVDARFSGPDDQTLSVPGYYAGGTSWKVRYALPAEGTWHYSIHAPARLGAKKSGKIECLGRAPGSHGPVKVSGAHPHHLTFADGTPHYMMAYECDWLWAIDLGRETVDRTADLLDQIAANRFNHILVNLYAHDTSWCAGTTSEDDYGPPAMYAWGGSNENPDHSRLNLAFFDHWDRVIDLMERRGLTAHLYFKVYNKGVNWPAPRSPEERLTIRYVLARYQAYWNLIWDVSKEAFYEPDKRYLYDLAESIRDLDAYHHMVTVHDDLRFTSEPFLRQSIDLCTAQQHVDFYESALNARTAFAMPYFNSEFGYEHGPEGYEDFTYKARNTLEEFVDRAYQVAMAGAYPAYYYTYTTWDVVDWSYNPPVAKLFGVLYEFFTSLDWWAFEPAWWIVRSPGARALVRRGSPSGSFDELLVYVYDKENRSALITERLEYDSYDGRWLDIYSGEQRAMTWDDLRPFKSGGLRSVKVPFESGVGVLHLKKTNTRESP